MSESIREVHIKNNVPSGTDNLIIAGDVSATNVFGGIYSISGNERTTVFEATYKGQNITDFNEQIIEDMLETNKLINKNIRAAVFSPAGPIIDGKCQMTNAHFSLDASSMGIPAALINDFKAIAYSVATLEPGKLKCASLNPSGIGEPGGRIGIHGAGTGFGTARLEYNKDKGLYFPLDSEGGHKFLPINPADKTEVKIVRWLMFYSEGKKPNYEDVLSGRGIERLFQFFANRYIKSGRAEEISNYLGEFKHAKDKAEYVGQKAANFQNPHPIFMETMDFFWKTYGRSLHDLAVHENARGGIWVAGGIIRKHYGSGESDYKERLRTNIMGEFNSGGTHRDWVGNIPVTAILDKRVGLEGCIQVAANEEYMKREMH